MGRYKKYSEEESKEVSRIESSVELNPQLDPFSLARSDENKVYRAVRNNPRDIAIKESLGYQITQNSKKCSIHDKDYAEKHQATLDRVFKENPELKEGFEKARQTNSQDSTVVIGDLILMEISKEKAEKNYAKKMQKSNERLEMMKTVHDKFVAEMRKQGNRFWQKVNGREF